MHHKNFWFMRQPEFWLGRAMAKCIKYERRANTRDFQQTVSLGKMQVKPRRPRRLKG